MKIWLICVVRVPKGITQKNFELYGYPTRKYPWNSVFYVIRFEINYIIFTHCAREYSG